MYTLGVDVGGTFTDLVAVDHRTNEVLTTKVPSQRDDPGAAVIAGVEELDLLSKGISRLIHGTTVATNALLERRGAKTALITTKGFRDITQFNRGRRLASGGMFDVSFRRPKPLVPRDLRFEVHERIRASGEVLISLDPESIETAAEALKERKVDAVAVCFLHSYAHPQHEVEAVRQLRELLGPTVFISYSHDVNPQFREFERFSTTIVNAYVGPVVEAYLDDLREHPMPGDAQPVMHIMGSAGGILDFETAARYPVRTILSGPAGGVRAAQYVGKDIGHANLITCDIGGTSADVALLQGERVFYANETNLSGVSIRAAQLEINTIGAGAGSVIWVDIDGALCVGPHSAGAQPGPACYGKGGKLPTVTDANVVLNRIGDGALLGNSIRVDAKLAREALEPIRQRLGFASIESAAEGALQILVAKTVRAIREVSVERGFDPRSFSLVAFGGAGPMHAAAIADGLGMATVVIPNYPGNLSAFGLVVASVRRDTTAPFFSRCASLDLAGMASKLRDAGDFIRRELMRSSAISDSIRLTYFLAMRSVGQAHEISVRIPTDERQITARAIRKLFDEAYAERYGRDPDPNIDAEILEIHVAGEGQVEQFSRDIWRVQGTGPSKGSRTRKAWFNNSPHDARIVERKEIPAGQTIAGPATIEEQGATTIIPPEWTAVVHDTGHIIMTKR